VIVVVIVVDEVRPVPDVDLNCRENVSLNSDSDEHSDDETIENKVFPQQRFSPVTCPMHPAALRPRPIKVGARTEETLVTATPAVRPSASTVAFQPHGEVFKARASQSLSSAGKPNVCRVMIDNMKRVQIIIIVIIYLFYLFIYLK